MQEKLFRIIDRRFKLLCTLFAFGAVSAYVGVYIFFARPRSFKGDFYAAMFTSNWWDGTGLFYGPLFVFERWFVNSFPRIATVNFFAFQVFLVLFVSLLITLRIVHADKVFTLFGLTVWITNSYFYYSFSVAANPEILELLFLVLMWWAISQKYIKLAYIFFSLAVITKITPIIFFPLLLLVFKPEALLVSLLIILVSILIVAFGQQQGVLLIIKDLIPASIVDPQPDSEQFLGLSTALSRVFGISPKGDFTNVTNLAIGLTIVLVLLIYYVSFAVFRSLSASNYESSVAYVFSAFMSIMPLIHLTNTHRHTFLFLGPVWISLRYVYINDTNSKRSLIFSRIFMGLFLFYSALPIYFLDVFPASKFSGIHLGETLFSYIILSEPIWTNLLISLTILVYGFSIVRSSKNKTATSQPSIS